MMTTTPPLPEPTLTFVLVPAAILAGEKIAFLKDNNLQLVNVASRAQFQVTTSDNVSHIFGWSYDGSQLLLGVGERPRLPETDMPWATNLWMLNVKEGRAVQITRDLKVRNAAWSPINDQLAYTTLNDELYLIKSDGGDEKQLVAKLAGGGLAWSPSGTELAYVQLQQPGDWATMDIVVISMIDGSTLQLTSRAWENTDPQWSLDGQRILFQSNRTETAGTGLWWTTNRNGDNLSHLEASKRVAYRGVDVSRSPAADRIAFTDGKDIWIMDFAGNAQMIASGSEPNWSPSGNQLVYVGDAREIYVIDVNGTNSKKLNSIGTQPYWGK
jgi:Tol biopolymer transport system component